MTTTLPTCYGCFVNQSWVTQPIYDNIPAPQQTPLVHPHPLFFMNFGASLTEEEKEIVNLLALAFNKFVALGEKHPADDSEFCTAIHDAQKTVAMRVARRCNPDVWTQYPQESVDNV